MARFSGASYGPDDVRRHYPQRIGQRLAGLAPGDHLFRLLAYDADGRVSHNGFQRCQGLLEESISSFRERRMSAKRGSPLPLSRAAYLNFATIGVLAIRLA